MKTIDIAILTNIKGLGPKNIMKILDYCKYENINNLYELKDVNLNSVVGNKLASKINSYLEIDLDNLYKNMKNIINGYSNDGIFCLSINDEKYPSTLKKSTNPPIILYCKGNIDLLNTQCIATIGTRENTQIGERIATKTVDFLVQNNFTIVSGLAKGIDTICHKAALKNQGNTIAVLPLIDKIYPAENKQLAKDILNANGLLISEEKPNTKFYSAQLVKRDRIQSGLSNSVFVIETSIKGGSMHATRDAISLKRNVFSPDIYMLDKNYQSLKQVEGIKSLIDNNESIAYTSNNYDEILYKIKSPLKKNTLW